MEKSLAAERVGKKGVRRWAGENLKAGFEKRMDLEVLKDARETLFKATTLSREGTKGDVR